MMPEKALNKFKESFASLYDIELHESVDSRCTDRMIYIKNNTM